MSESFIGEIRLFGFGDAPENWAKCDGTTIPIDQNPSLYNTIGNTFGGAKDMSFNLPEMRGRVPVHMGAQGTGARVSLGEISGHETKTLTLADMYPHTHDVTYTSQEATSRQPDRRVLAQTSQRLVYGSESGVSDLVDMNPLAISYSCDGKPLDNMQQSLVLNFCIALTGR